MTKLLTHEDVAEKLFWHIRKNYRSQSAAAQRWGVTPSFVSACIHEKKKPNKKMLEEMGLETIDGYRELK